MRLWMTTMTIPLLGLTRLSYHAVPRIILDPQFCIDGE